jgi:hypothetical protein
MKVTDSISEIGGVLPRSDLQAGARESTVLWGFSPDRAEAVSRPVPWWLWWNILSLDAPTVAVAWAALFALDSGTRLSAAELAALALSVWIIYTSDRLLDGWTAKNRSALQERHLFCQRHPFALTVLLLAATAMVLWLMINARLTLEAVAGFKLGLIVVIYMAGTHTRRGGLVSILPKEISVGLLFAMGATLPLWSRSAQFPWHAIPTWGFFGLLCSLNCLSIECWENRTRDGWKMCPHPFVCWVSPRLNLIAGLLAASSLMACFMWRPTDPYQSALLAVSAGALLLLLLNRAAARLSASALRVLADAALLVPAFLALLIRG